MEPVEKKGVETSPGKGTVTSPSSPARGSPPSDVENEIEISFAEEQPPDVAQRTVRASNHHDSSPSSSPPPKPKPTGVGSLFDAPFSSQAVPDKLPPKQPVALPKTAAQQTDDIIAAAVMKAAETGSSAGSKPPSIPKPNTIQQRMISWGTGVKGPDPSYGLADLSSLSKPSSVVSPGRKISLEELTQQHPLETEAETRVLQAVEDHIDPTRTSVSNKSVSSAWSGILRNIPNGAERAFDVSTDQSQLGYSEDAPSNGRSPPPGLSKQKSIAVLTKARSQKSLRSAAAKIALTHRRQQTMEQRLDGLTDALEAIHGADEMLDMQESSAAAGEPSRVPTGYGSAVLSVNDDTPVMGSADVMNKHANLLYQRRKKTEDSAAMEEAAKKKAAQDRWNKLRTAHFATMQATQSGEDHAAAVAAAAAATSPTVSDRPNTDIEAGESSFNDQHEASKHHLDLTVFKSRSRIQIFLELIPGVRELIAFGQANRVLVITYLKVIIGIMLPATAISVCLFYFADNPPTGRIDAVASAKNGTLVNHLGQEVEPTQASASYWLLFMCVRQLITLSMAQATQLFIIDFLCVGRQWTTKVLGPIATLLIIQSRGWPFIFFWWSVYDFVLNYGENKFAAHWLFFQDIVGVFNDENPSGEILTAKANFRALVIALCVGAIVSLKRTWIGFFLGRKTYVNYAADLANIMRKIVLLSRIAQLAKDIEHDYVMHEENEHRDRRASRVLISGLVHDRVTALVNTVDDDDGNDTCASFDMAQADENEYVIDPEDRDKLTGELTEAQRIKINSLLGAWEEPETGVGVDREVVSVRAILKFRQSLTFLETPFMFSYSFGLVDTRTNCIESAQEVYLRLLLDDPESEILNFDIIATLALREDRTFHQKTLKDLISLLRPDREGRLTLLDFVKSVDAVYKQARLLRASVKNSQKIDLAFEMIFNIIFYIIIACIILSQLGFDPRALFLSMSGIILAFAFMIGSASAKYFEGLLFILVQRPYDIGDRINIEPANSPSNSAGSASWFIRDVTLFTTTIVLASTNERATVSNGALAANRIINGARSPNATLSTTLRFGIDTPREKIQIFHEALTQFIKARPREWMSLLGFRTTNIFADQGFVEYVIILQHRSSWQYVPALKASMAEVQAFSVELANKLHIRYKRPPLPVNMTLHKTEEADSGLDPFYDNIAGFGVNSEEIQKVASMFDKKNT